MVAKDNKNQNSVNLFLNSYFNIIIVFIVIVVFLVSYLVVIKPKYDETMAAIKLNIEQQQKLYTDQQKKLNSLKAVADLYKKISSADLKKFNSVLPDTYIKERLFGEFEEIVNQSGFILSSVSLQADEKEKPGDITAENTSTSSTKIGTVNLELAVSAIDYTGFKNLVKLMENNLRLFDITKVTFSPASNAATIVLSTYYYKK